MKIAMDKVSIIIVFTICTSLLLGTFFLNSSLLFFTTIFLIAFMLISRNYFYLENNKRSYVILVVVHILLLLYQTKFHNLPMSGGDWGVYASVSQGLLARENALLDIINPLTFGKIRGDMYERMCAFVYYFYGFNQSFMYSVSFLAAEITFYNIYRSAKIVVQEKDSKIPFLSAVVFYSTPLEMVYSVDFLREMVIQAVFSVSLYYFVRYMYGVSNKFYPVVICSIVMSVFHSGFVGVLIGYIATYVFFDKKANQVKISVSNIVVLMLLVVLLYISPLWSIVASRFSDVGSVSDLGQKVSYSSKYSVGTTNYISAPSSSLGVIVQTPIRIVLYLLSPLPWQVRSLGTAIAMVLDGSVRWLLEYRIFKLFVMAKKDQLYNSKSKPLIYAALIILGCTTLIFSWGTNNYGTAMRHRTSLYALEILLFVTLWHIEKRGASNE